MELYVEAGELDKAQRCAARGLEISRRTPIPADFQSFCLLILAECHAEAERKVEARNFLRRGITLLGDLSLSKERKVGHLNVIRRVWRKLGDKQEADFFDARYQQASEAASAIYKL